MVVRVSIIIANHRWDSLFKETVKSVLNHTSEVCHRRNTTSEVEKAEIIVINNGLDFDKADRVRRWLKNKPVKLLQIQEGNPSKARNVGARVARGK